MIMSVLRIMWKEIPEYPELTLESSSERRRGRNNNCSNYEYVAGWRDHRTQRETSSADTQDRVVRSAAYAH